MPERIGLYGGTFDPVHHGHLILARDAAEQLMLDRVLFIPAAVSPHRTDLPPTATQAQRLAMLRHQRALRGDQLHEIAVIAQDRGEHPDDDQRQIDRDRAERPAVDEEEEQAERRDADRRDDDRRRAQLRQAKHAGDRGQREEEGDLSARRDVAVTINRQTPGDEPGRDQRGEPRCRAHHRERLFGRNSAIAPEPPGGAAHCAERRCRSAHRLVCH